MKYLITKSNQVKVFPDSTSHSDMASKKNIKSAGYFKQAGDSIKTYGKSHSTGIPSKKEDAVKVLKKIAQLNHYLGNR